MTTQRVSQAETAAVFQQERDAAGGQSAPAAVGNVLNAVVKFEKVESFTTYLAEYAFVDGNIVFHFFPPKEAYVAVPGTDRHQVEATFLIKWQRVFPVVLSPLAEQYFQATKPVLVAQYVPEMSSWWMRAGGFARRLDAGAFTLGFLEQLDAALDRSSSYSS